MGENNKIVFLDKHDFPIEKICGHPILNFFRLLFLTKKIERYEKFYKRTDIKVDFRKFCKRCGAEKSDKHIC